MEVINNIGKTEQINEENIIKLYGNTLKTSVSKLEQYRKCPFSFYLKYGLQLKEKEELIENENNILLESLTDEQKESVKNTLTQNMTEQINRVLQVVSLDSVRNMLVNIDIMKAEAENIENEGITEAERNRFNSDFELFEGENITKERVIELMNIAKGALEDIRITQYKEQNNSSDERIPAEYRLVIRGNTENATLAEQFVSYIEEGNDNNFSVRLEYDEETGLVNNVYITIME